MLVAHLPGAGEEETIEQVTKYVYLGLLPLQALNTWLPFCHSK
jgi:hypothetical protein